MTQVFITNTNSDLQAASAPDYWSDLSGAGALGIWNQSGNSGHGAWMQTALYQITNLAALPATSATNFPADGADSNSAATVEAIADQMRLDRAAGALTSLVQGVPLVPSFQICQGYGSGNPIASPIISAGSLVDITYQPHNAGVKGVYDLAFNGATVAVGDELTVKVQIRFSGEPSLYESQINPAAGNIGAVSSLLIDSRQHVFNVSAIATAATDQNVMDLLIVEINKHPVLKTILTASSENSGTTDDLRLTCKLFGMHLSAQLLFKGAKQSTSTTVTIPEMGVGNFHQVLSDEKKARYASGNFNRMYFPQDFTTFATSGTVYDKIVVRYRNNISDNVLRGGQAGINTAIIYGVDTGTGGNNDFEEVFPTSGDAQTASKIAFSGAAGFNSAVSV